MMETQADVGDARLITLRSKGESTYIQQWAV